MLVMKPGFLFYIVKDNISISNIYFFFSSKRTIEALLACRLTMGYNGRGCVKVLAIETISYSPATKLRILCQSYSLRS